MEVDEHFDTVNCIIKELKGLGYSPNHGNWNYECIKETLTISCTSRFNLLFWILELFGFHYAAQDMRLKDQTIKKILNDLASIGLCRPEDLKVIDATASTTSQLKFWESLLDTCVKFKSDGPNLESDKLLHSLVLSPHFDYQLKDVDLNLLPEELKIPFKKCNTAISLNNEFESLKMPNGEDHCKRTWNRNDEGCTELQQAIMHLRTQNEAFVATHDAYFNSWCKVAQPQMHENTFKTGDLASQCLREFQTFIKTVSLFKEVELSSEEIKKNSVRVAQEKIEGGKPIAILQSIQD